MPDQRQRFRPQTITRPQELDGFPADTEAYVFDNDEVWLAVDVALVTGRPLLVYGPAGCGKSTLGPNIARYYGWPWATEVVSARTEPEDLLWHYDALRRLNDANGGHLRDDEAHYYGPGLLWRAFAARDGDFVAVIDEIDKADPDIPSSLLRPLGSFSFATPWGDQVEADRGRPPLIVITTNDERELSRPFLRRCVTIELPQPGRTHLLHVAQCHLGADYSEALAVALIAELGRGGHRPSTAEFLDTLKASVLLGIAPGSPRWEQLTKVTLLKERQAA